MTATAKHAEPERTAIQERRLTSSAITEDASATASANATASATESTLQRAASGRSTMEPMGTDLDESGAATGGIRALEREHILKVLHQVGGSRKRAVEILGISERTLRYKLKLWRESGIQVP
jgi:two-component system response regulator FlrC